MNSRVGVSRILVIPSRLRYLVIGAAASTACFMMLLLSSPTPPPAPAAGWPRRRPAPPAHATITTDGCTIPALQAFDPLVAHLNTRPKLNSCDLDPPILHNNETHIWVDEEFNSEPLFACCYRPFYRPSSISDIYDIYVDDRVKYDKCEYFRDVFQAKDEFVRVTCKLDKDVIHDEFFLFAVAKPFIPLEERSDATDPPPDNYTAYNVLVLGIDAVSRLNFHRTMPNTLAYLRKRGAIEFLGYNKVGDNTFPNVVPLLLGIRETELKNTCWRNWRNSFDNCPFVWDAFREGGYLTALGEDSASLGTFNYQKIGFYTNPTNYYLHTFMHEAEKYVGKNKDFNSFLCMGRKFFYRVLMDYIDQLTSVLDGNKLFGFFWEVTMSHDYVNYPLVMDNYYADFFRKKHESGYLDKTIIVLMSDHGLRWGKIRLTKQGRIEERLPLLHILMPSSFRENYSLAYKNLKLNSKRLTTPFDVHATLLDLADLNSLKDSEIQSRGQEPYADRRSISLFLPIPENRTCKVAEIDDHWCTCHVTEKLDPAGVEAQGAAAYVTGHLNRLLSGHRQCASLNVSEVMEASEMVSGAPEQHEVGWRELVVVWRAAPSGAVFEATVRRLASGTHSLAGTVSRLNLYGDQSRCMHDYTLKLYCYCT